VGQKPLGKWNWKYATAILPDSKNAVGRCRRPELAHVATSCSGVGWSSSEQQSDQRIERLADLGSRISLPLAE